MFSRISRGSKLLPVCCFMLRILTGWLHRKFSSEILATLSSPQAGISLSFTSNQPGLQAWSGPGAFDGSDARKAIHGGRSIRGEGDGYVCETSPALAMEFHASECDSWVIVVYH